MFVHSNSFSPIVQKGLLERSLLFSELSNIAYMKENQANHWAGIIGFHDLRFINRDGSQAYIFENQYDCVIACRGTEPNEWNDLKADIDAVSVVAETIGRVHRGFKKEVDDLWPVLENKLISNTKTLWFCGHSLGGAMAAICAGRCYLAHIPSVPTGLFTYGSPRVGNTRYVNHVKLEYFRWVNNNDIVTRVPPAWMNYRHTGQEMYVNAYGRVREMTGWQRTKDRWRGFWMGIKNGEIDNFSDHSIDLYIKAIFTGLEYEKSDAMDKKSFRALKKAITAQSNTVKCQNLSDSTAIPGEQV